MGAMRAKLNCIECLVTGAGKQRAEFIVNGQSVCERHVLAPVRDRSEGAYAYTFAAPDGQMTLEPVYA